MFLTLLCLVARRGAAVMPALPQVVELGELPEEITRRNRPATRKRVPRVPRRLFRPTATAFRRVTKILGATGLRRGQVGGHVLRQRIVGMVRQRIDQERIAALEGLFFLRVPLQPGAEQERIESHAAVAAAEEPLADDLFHFHRTFSQIGGDRGQGVLLAPTAVVLIRKQFPRPERLLAAPQRQRQHDQRGVRLQLRCAAWRQQDFPSWCGRPACLLLVIRDACHRSVCAVGLANKDLARRHLHELPFGKPAVGSEDEVYAKAGPHPLPLSGVRGDRAALAAFRRPRL